MEHEMNMDQYCWATKWGKKSDGSERRQMWIKTLPGVTTPKSSNAWIADVGDGGSHASSSGHDCYFKATAHGNLLLHANYLTAYFYVSLVGAQTCFLTGGHFY